MVDRIILIFFVYLVIILSSPCQITGCVLYDATESPTLVLLIIAWS